MEAQLVKDKKELSHLPIKRNISVLVSTSALGEMADAIYTLTVAWYVLDRTGSAFITSVITAITFIMRVFAGPFVGVLVDRTNPKRAIQKAYVAMALIGIILIFAYLFWNDNIVFAVMAMVILNDLAQSFIFPSRNRMLPNLIGTKRIPEVSGYLHSSSRTAMLLGNAIAGILFSTIGFIGVMLTHSILFLLASLLVSWLVLPKFENEKKVFTKKIIGLSLKKV